MGPVGMLARVPSASVAEIAWPLHAVRASAAFSSRADWAGAGAVPVIIRWAARAWIGSSCVMDRMRLYLSAIAARRGNPAPSNSPVLVLVTPNGPRISRGASGFGSNASRWLRPPARKMNTRASAVARVGVASVCTAADGKQVPKASPAPVSALVRKKCLRDGGMVAGLPGRMCLCLLDRGQQPDLCHSGRACPHCNRGYGAAATRGTARAC